MAFLSFIKKIPQDIGNVFHGGENQQPQPQQNQSKGSALGQIQAAKQQQNQQQQQQAPQQKITTNPIESALHAVAHPATSIYHSIGNNVVKPVAKNTEQSVVSTVKNVMDSPAAHALSAVEHIATGNVQGAKQEIAKAKGSVNSGLKQFAANPAASVSEGGLEESLASEGKGAAASELKAPKLEEKASALKATNKNTKPPKPQQRGFTSSVKNSPEVSADVRKQTQASYTPTQNKELTTNSKQLVDQGLDKATNKVTNALGQSSGRVTPQDISDAIHVAKEHDRVGNYEQATSLYDRLASHATRAGQKVQAFSLLASRTPEGLRNMALNTIKKSGAEITPEIQAKVKQGYENIKSTEEGSDERSYAVQDLQKTINDNSKQSAARQVGQLWRTGLLTGPLTATKVAVSHGVMNAAEKLKDVPATVADEAIFRGRQLAGKDAYRSTALTMKGTAKGAVEGGKAGVRLLTTGHDQPGTSSFGSGYDELGHPQVSYGTSKAGSALNFYTRKTGQVHAAIPKPFYKSAAENDLNKQAIASAKSQGLKGADRDEFVKNFVAKPSDQAVATSNDAAAHATFQQPTKLGETASKFQKLPGGRALAPFAHIASAILTDVKDYSPIGAVQSIYKAYTENAKNGWSPELQKDLVEGIGRGVTGTGIVWLGTQLAKNGHITNGYPTDKNEQQLWKSEGKTSDSILVDGKWRNTASLGPLGSLLAAGSLLQSSKGTDAKGKSNATAALTGALDNISSQSYLSGLTQAAAAVQNPEENAKSFAKLEAGSVVPVGLAQTATAADKYNRTVKSPADAIKSKIPGLREQLPISQDMFGRDLTRTGGFLTGITDPSRPSQAINDKTVNELQTLKTNTGSTATPTTVTKIAGKNSAGKSQPTNLTIQQQAAFNKLVGPKIKSAEQSTISSPSYSQLSDDDKVTALNDAKNNVETVEKAKYLKSLNNGTSVKLTENQQINNTKDYAQSALDKENGVTGSNQTPAQKYQADQDKYNAQVKANKLSEVDQSQALPKLAKEKVESKYSGDAVKLYGESAKNIASYFDSHNDPKLENEITSMDADMVKAGIISKTKFSSTSISGSKVASSKGGGSSSGTAARNSEFSTLENSFKLFKTSKGSKLSIPKPAGVKSLRAASVKAKAAPRVSTRGFKLKKGAVA